MRDYSILAFAIIIIIGIMFVSRSNGVINNDSRAEAKHAEVKIAGVKISAEIADTPRKQTRGLSGRDTLPEGAGMLFIYDTSERRSFWMKEMRFPIDIIWIGEDMKVVGLRQNISPDSFPEKFLSPAPVKFVLEVDAGFADEHDIKIGDELVF